MSFLPHTMACGNRSAESACPPFTLRKADEQERWSSERAKERKASMNTPARTDRARDTLLHTFAADMTEGTYPIAREYFARRITRFARWRTSCPRRILVTSPESFIELSIAIRSRTSRTGWPNWPEPRASCRGGDLVNCQTQTLTGGSSQGRQNEC
jgi:hypothetical protein